MRSLSSIIKSSHVIKIIPSKSEPNIKKDEKEDIINEKILEAIKKSDEIATEAENKAKEIIHIAKVESESYIEEAYTKAASIVEEARKKGYNEGFQEGKMVSDKLIEEANDLKKEYFLQRENLLREVEEDVINLTVNICEKILGDFVEENKEAIISIISKGINSLNAREKMIIRVSSGDFDFVEMSKDRILSMANQVEDIEIKADNTLEPGSCVIETSKGSVDSSLKTQFDEIKDLIQNLLNSE